MSKAVLVVDMPENCNGCEMCDRIPGPWCRATGGVIAGDPESGRAGGCPLKELPGPADAAGYDQWESGYMVGWNELLQKIGGF